MKKKHLSLEEEISERLAVFAHEIANLARVRTLDQLRGAFAKGIGAALDTSAAEALSGNYAGPVKAARRAPAPVKWAKRDPKAIAQLGVRFVRYVQRRPGSSVEQIARGMQCRTSALTLPVHNALAAGEVTKKGERRATRYYPK